MVMHSVIDILGLNPLSTAVFRNAAAAMAGMVRAGAGPLTPGDGRFVAVTMLGNTTTAVMELKSDLEAAGFGTVIFHANGVGGPAMEELIAAGMFVGVIDYTPQELADNVVGGFHVGRAAAHGGCRRRRGYRRLSWSRASTSACMDRARPSRPTWRIGQATIIIPSSRWCG